MSDTNGLSRCPGQELARELVAASGARPGDNVTIAGSGHIEILVEFIRHGFSDVLCRSAVHGPHMAAPPADVLIAPDVASEADLQGILTRLASDLRPRGVLVISCAQTVSSFDERRLRRRLMESGFTAVERIAARGHAGIIWRAHKQAASVRRAA